MSGGTVAGIAGAIVACIIAVVAVAFLALSQDTAPTTPRGQPDSDSKQPAGTGDATTPKDGQDKPTVAQMNAEILRVRDEMEKETEDFIATATPKSFDLRTSEDVRRYREEIRKLNQPVLDALKAAPEAIGDKMRGWLIKNWESPTSERDRVLREFINEYIAQQ